ncbi:MAG: ECF transporter S component [Bacteroidales bacterium]
MQTATLNLYSLGYTQLRTYLIASAFVVGNIVLPQLAHFVPQGGFIFLPIYFFTLVAGYKYGWRAGLLTAIASPVVNHLLFGMPPMAVLPAILVKSIFLAITAGVAANYFKRVSLTILLLVVMTYQLFGTMVEWALIGDLFKAIQDFRIGIPGMLLQVFGGYLTINYLIRK